MATIEKIDRAMIYLIVAMLAFMVSLFFEKINMTPALVRREVIESRQQILNAVASAKRDLHNEINSLPTAIVLRLSNEGDRLLRKNVNENAN